MIHLNPLAIEGRRASSSAASSHETVSTIEELRCRRKFSAARIAVELEVSDIMIPRRTVTGILVRLGLSTRKFIDPTGAHNRKPGIITANHHSDKTKSYGAYRCDKRSGRFLMVAEGFYVAEVKNRRPAGRARVSCTSYLHSAVDGFSHLMYTEVFTDETAVSATELETEFLRNARVFFTAHGITRIGPIVTDHGVCYRARATGLKHSTQAVSRQSRHQRMRPYIPKHHGKVERFHRIMVEDLHWVRPLCPPVHLGNPTA